MKLSIYLAAFRCQIWLLREFSCAVVVSKASGDHMRPPVQIQFLREMFCSMVASKASGALCAPRSGLDRGKSCKKTRKSVFLKLLVGFRPDLESSFLKRYGLAVESILIVQCCVMLVRGLLGVRRLRQQVFGLDCSCRYT